MSNRNVDIRIGERKENLSFDVDFGSCYLFVGWTSGTKAEFAALTPEELMALSIDYPAGEQAHYRQDCIDEIFFILFPESFVPLSGSLVTDSLVSPITQADFLAGGSCPHEPFLLDGLPYRVYGLRNRDLVGGGNYIIVNFV